VSFEPQKYFIGLIDFFSVLLPWALLTFLLQDDVGALLLGVRYAKLTGAEGWAVFLFASYLLGHFTFLVGSWLDENVYDNIRGATEQAQVARIVERKRLSSFAARLLATLHSCVWRLIRISDAPFQNLTEGEHGNQRLRASKQGDLAPERGRAARRA
jgi:hypothetical protein